ncbi:MAG: urea ABC transporter permease subunit UrtC, partial [Kiloniellaceae bacterium]
MSTNLKDPLAGISDQVERMLPPNPPPRGGSGAAPYGALGRALGGRAWIFLAVVAAVAVLIPVFNQLVPESSGLQLPNYIVGLSGKYLCFALLAVSVDLVWGFCGILSLGHGAFFALGGYAMGM